MSAVAAEKSARAIFARCRVRLPGAFTRKDHVWRRIGEQLLLLIQRQSARSIMFGDELESSYSTETEFTAIFHDAIKVTVRMVPSPVLMYAAGHSAPGPRTSVPV